MSDDQIRADFEKKIKLDKGVYWCDSAQCYMRDAGGGFTVHDRTANHRLEGWQAAHARYAAQPRVPEGFLRWLGTVVQVSDLSGIKDHESAWTWPAPPRAPDFFADYPSLTVGDLRELRAMLTASQEQTK